MSHVNRSLGDGDRHYVAGTVARRDLSSAGRLGLLNFTQNPVGCARPAERVGLPYRYILRAPRRVCRAGAARIREGCLRTKIN